MSATKRALKAARRRENRIRRKYERMKPLMEPENVFGAQALFDAAKTCKNGVWWKQSVIEHIKTNLAHAIMLHDEIMNGDYRKREPVHFILNERGKERLISAVRFRDRDVQRSLCDNNLVPIVSNTLIYDNGASLSGKGTSFTRNRLRNDMLKAFNQYVRNVNNDYMNVCMNEMNNNNNDSDSVNHENNAAGESWKQCNQDKVNLLYENNDELRGMNKNRIQDNKWIDPHVVVFDYHNYFGSIDSMIVFEQLQSMYEHYAIDMEPFVQPDEQNEFNAFKDNIQKILDILRIFIHDEKHLGLGNQTSQTMAIWFVNKIDHMASSYGYYGRYMDDGYCICPDRQSAESFKRMLIKESDRIGLTMNPHKLKMFPLQSGCMHFMKRDYKFDEHGMLHVRMSVKSLKYNHRHVRNVIQHTDGIMIDLRTIVYIGLAFKANIQDCTDRTGLWKSYAEWFNDLCHENGFNDFNVRRDKELLMQERPKSYRKTCKHKNKRINRIIKIKCI